jgi:hypothetical protein
MEVLIPITLFLSIAAVLILRPLTRRVGVLLEALARQKQEEAALDRDGASLRRALEEVSRRLELVEERLEFTERLVESTRRPTLERSRPRPGDALRPGVR